MHLNEWRKIIKKRPSLRLRVKGKNQLAKDMKDTFMQKSKFCGSCIQKSMPFKIATQTRNSVGQLKLATQRATQTSRFDWQINPAN